MLISGRNFDIEHQPQRGDKIRVKCVARASRFMRVVAERCAFLVAVDGLDGGVDVEDPRQSQSGFPRRTEMLSLPRGDGIFIRTEECSTHAVLAANGGHPEAARVHRIGP